MGEQLRDPACASLKANAALPTYREFYRFLLVKWSGPVGASTPPGQKVPPRGGVVITLALMYAIHAECQ
jgi:hypothetical protein